MMQGRLMLYAGVAAAMIAAAQGRGLGAPDGTIVAEHAIVRVQHGADGAGAGGTTFEWYRAGERLWLHRQVPVESVAYEAVLSRLNFDVARSNTTAVVQYLATAKWTEVDLQVAQKPTALAGSGPVALLDVIGSQLADEFRFADWLKRQLRHTPVVAATSEQSTFAPPIYYPLGHAVAAAESAYEAASVWPKRLVLRDTDGTEAATITVTAWQANGLGGNGELPKTEEWLVHPGKLPMQTTMAVRGADGNAGKEVWSAQVTVPERRIVKTITWLDNGESFVQESSVFDDKGVLIVKYTVLKFEKEAQVAESVFH